MTSKIESALLIQVPEAEPLVGSYRNKYDPSEAWGIPAHITVLYPFIPPNEITESNIKALQNLFAQFPRFKAKLAGTRMFPDALYLFPEPGIPFRELTGAVYGLYPVFPPYGGAYADVIPHLTVAQVNDKEFLGQIAADFDKSFNARLPISIEISEVALWENSSGDWRLRAKFPLGEWSKEK
jgi:2'-5' RNA ligase